MIQQYHDDVLGNILINKVTDEFNFEPEVYYMVNMGFC